MYICSIIKISWLIEMQASNRFIFCVGTLNDIIFTSFYMLGVSADDPDLNLLMLLFVLVG